jgi:hypothetical protein
MEEKSMLTSVSPIFQDSLECRDITELFKNSFFRETTPIAHVLVITLSRTHMTFCSVFTILTLRHELAMGSGGRERGQGLGGEMTQTVYARVNK